jgi:hypothetical protein
MIHVSLQDFVRTGEFGPLRLGMMREDVRSVLSERDGYTSYSNGDRMPSRLQYRNVTLMYPFAGSLDDRLFWIMLEDFATPSGGPHISIDPWVLHSGLTFDAAAVFFGTAVNLTTQLRSVVWRSVV